MATRAAISPGYRWRLGIIGLVCLGFAGLCFYDGYYKYPRQRQIAIEFLEFKELHGNDYLKPWHEHATAQGYSLEDPGKPKGDWDIYTQYIMLAITLPFGLIFGTSFIRSSGRWIEMDEKGFTTSWGQTVPLSGVTQLNKERWYSKGIAQVRYKADEQGIERTLVLDDWKFDRTPIKEMVDKVYESLSPEQVIGHKDVPTTEDAPAGDPPADKDAG